MSKKHGIWIVVTVLAICLVGCDYIDSLGEDIVKNESMVTEFTTEERMKAQEPITEFVITEQNTTEEIQYNEFENWEVVDYAALYCAMKEGGGEISGCELLDVDKDGLKEFFVVRTISSDSIAMGRSSNYCFDDYELPFLDIYTDISAAGSACMYIDRDIESVYLNKTYSTAGFICDSYYIWDNGWNVIAEYEASYNIQTDEYDVTKSNWLGKEISQEEWFESASAQQQNLSDLVINEDNLIICIEQGNYVKIIDEYKQHLDKLGLIYTVEGNDVDDDGEEEVCYSIENYARPWQNNMNSLNELEEECFMSGNNSGISTVIIDLFEENVVFGFAYEEK